MTTKPKSRPKAPPPTRAGRVVAASNTWRQNYNPLRWLDINRAVLLLERERRGDLAEIQWTYEIIDQSDPDMIALISLRTSAIKRLRPGVTAEKSRRGYDAALAAEQEDLLSEIYARLDMAEAAEDLAMATFRGFTIKQILRDAEGMPESLSTLDRWNFARDGYRGPWYWNPRAAGATGASLPERDRIGGPELPAADFLIREERLAVDRACIVLGIRTSTCEKDWDAWCEMYGLNQCILTEPPNADPADRPHYDAAARAFSDGQGGTVAHGASATFPQGARTASPFKDRAEYLTRKKVLAGTSGRLTMLAEPGTGTLAGHAHQDTFDALADAEAADICALVNRAITADVLNRAFPGRPHLAAFALLRDTPDDRDQAADRIAKLGPYFEIDPAAASEATGVKLSRKEAPPPPDPGPWPPFSPRSAASQPQPGSRAVAKPLQFAHNHCKTSGRTNTAAGTERARGENNGLLERGVVSAFSRDLAAWRGRCAALLGLPPAERPAAARRLADEIEADPAAAPALKRALAAWIATHYAEAANRENPAPAAPQEGARP